MKPPEFKFKETSKADYELFKKEFMKWINLFGITDNVYEFKHDEIDNAYSFVIGDFESRRYLITFAKTFALLESPLKEQIKDTAFHEAMECLLYRLRCLIADRKFDEEVADSEVHAVINRLQGVLYNKKR